MANKNSRSTKANRKVGSRSGESSRKSGWYNRVGRRNIIIAIVFVVAFGSLGSWYLYKSYAYTNYCYSRVWAQGSSGQCVKDIQQMLHNIGRDNVYSGRYPGFNDSVLGYWVNGAWYPDGYYGSGTAQQVKYFQQYNTGANLYPDGKVGQYTGSTLCIGERATGRLWSYYDFGCQHYFGF